MATLVVHVEDALLERIADAAQERGEDTEHLIVEVLTQAFRSKATEDDMTLADTMQAVLAPFWAEQDEQEAGGKPPVPTETLNDEDQQERFRALTAQLFAEADAIERQPGTYTNPQKARVAAIIAEKHRKIGLDV